MRSGGAAEGVRTGGDARNRDFAAAAVELDGAAETSRGARLRPADGGRPPRVTLPADKAAVLEAHFAADGPLPRADRAGSREEAASGRLLMEAGARAARLRSLTVSPGDVRLARLRRARRALPDRRLGRDRAPDRLRARLRELAALRRHVPSAQGLPRLVEFGNRGVGVVVGLTTLAAAIVAFRVPGFPAGSSAAPWALPVTVLAQGSSVGSPSSSSSIR